MQQNCALLTAMVDACNGGLTSVAWMSRTAHSRQRCSVEEISGTDLLGTRDESPGGSEGEGTSGVRPLRSPLKSSEGGGGERLRGLSQKLAQTFTSLPFLFLKSTLCGGHGTTF